MLILLAFAESKWTRFVASIIFCMITTLSFAAPSLSSNEMLLLDEIAAVANGRLITRGEVVSRVALLQEQLRLAKKPVLSQEKLLDNVLEQLIIEALQTQEAHDTGLVVSDTELDHMLSKMAQSNHLTMQELVKEVERDQPFAKYRASLRKEMEIMRLRDREVLSKTQVFDSEIDNYLAEMKKDIHGPEELQIEQLMVALPSEASPEIEAQAQQRAANLLKQWRTGIDPKTLATRDVQYSDLGLRTTERLPSAFVDAVSLLKIGQLADQPIKGPNGWHILRLVDRRTAAGAVKLPQFQLRSIVLRLGKDLNETQAKRRLNDFRVRVKNSGDNFSSLAKQYSQDTFAANGGDMGWVLASDIPIEFVRALDQLQIGNITEPIVLQSTAFLLQLLDRRDVEITLEQQREFARNIIRERKNEGALNDWLRQLRENATVEYRAYRPK